CPWGAAALTHTHSFPGSLPLSSPPLFEFPLAPPRELARVEFVLAPSAPPPMELARAKLAVARAGYEARLKEYLAGKTTAEPVLEWSRRWLESEPAAHGQQADQLAALERHWLRAKQIEEVNRASYEKGSVAITQYLLAQY